MSSSVHSTWFMKASAMNAFSTKNKVESTSILLPTPKGVVRIKVLSLEQTSGGLGLTHGLPTLWLCH